MKNIALRKLSVRQKREINEGGKGERKTEDPNTLKGRLPGVEMNFWLSSRKASGDLIPL